MDFNLDLLALLGLGISSFVLITGCANMILMAALWGLYLSLVNVGQVWYSFGWESQLLETGFLGIFLCPWWTLSRLPRHTPTPWTVLWAFRWLIFRIMLGATQPVPSPLAYFLHRTPWWVHRFEALSNHFLELLVPFFLFLGRRMCILHGVLQILFQVVLILSGNLSFLNWLTIVPSLSCFDDASLGFLFPSGLAGLKDRALKLQDEEAQGAQSRPRHVGCAVRRVVNLSLGVLLAWLSVPVVLNLLSAKQVMNTTFGSLRIVNSYGAFGSITKERTEVILQGTASPNASAPDAVWEDYEFKCKPGDPWRRPCLITPYHYRLDWLMWFAAFQVDPSRALAVQVQPSWGQARRRGQVVGAQEARPLLPRSPPRGPGGLLQGAGLASLGKATIKAHGQALLCDSLVPIATFQEGDPWSPTGQPGTRPPSTAPAHPLALTGDSCPSSGAAPPREPCPHRRGLGLQPT
ncbi:lipase maturation factor 1 isoform X2 [Marmota marmota marmota]|uniref:lipase maturation factor 1 isoform X2 n=1 Tax=Marmota marmota marmota TaxID=9994 RepID=UPI002092E28A|nr:lipase maturation factor 1 isoform X2 [Marmota marmota marmota]